MKTTIDSPNPVVDEGRKLAERERSSFTLRKASFKGEGLRPELKNAVWDRLRELAFEGRNG